MFQAQYPHHQNNPLFETTTLQDRLKQDHPTIILAKKINWAKLEDFCSQFYSDKVGRASKFVRLMIGLLILKYMLRISDEQVVAQWSENVYYQAFTGQSTFVLNAPCHPTSLHYFRKRIGKEGCELIFAESVALFGPEFLEKTCIIDTTVQEKNITYPTESKLILKAIDYIKKIGSFLSMKFFRTYKNEIKLLKNKINFGKNSIDKSEKESAINRLREIANNLLDLFKKQLPKRALKMYPIKNFLMRLKKAINQIKTDKNKIYSIHEPQVKCIAKGKSDKKYEFGSKVSFVVSKCKGIILGALNFNNNPYDGDTIAPAIDQLSRLHGGYKPDMLIGDRGFKGRPEVKGVKIITPWDCKEGLLQKIVRKIKNCLRKRTNIEPIIGHLKADHLMDRNYLKGTLGDTINPLLAAAAFNFLKYARIEYEHLHRPPKSLAIRLPKQRKKVTNLPLWKKENNPLF